MNQASKHTYHRAAAAVLLLLLLIAISGFAQLALPSNSVIQARPSEQIELVLQAGHAKGIASIAFSPDGSMLASASYDFTIKLWDLATNRQLRTLSGHAGAVRSVAFAPGGGALASGSEDGTVRIWDIRRAKELHILKSPIVGSVKAVAFRPDGKTLASAGNGGITLWDVARATPLRTFRSRYDVWSIAFSPDGRILASEDKDLEVTLWNVETGTVLRTLKQQSRVESIAFSPDGVTLASGGQDKTIILRNVHTGAILKTLSEVAFPQSLAFSPDGKTLASASMTGAERITLWDVTSGRKVWAVNGTGHLAFSPDGKFLAAGGSTLTDGPNSSIVYGQSLKLREINTGREVQSLTAMLSGVEVLAFSPDGKMLASGASQKLGVWDGRTGRGYVPLGPHPDTTSLSFSSTGGTLASRGSLEFTTRLWDVLNGRQLPGVTEGWRILSSSVFSPDGSLMAAVTRDERSQTWVRLFNLAKNESLTLFQGEAILAFLPDGRLVTGEFGETTRIRFWDITGSSPRTLREQAIKVSAAYDRRSVTFSPDGAILAVKGKAMMDLRLWRTDTGAPLPAYRYLDEFAFSPDAMIIAGETYFDHEIKLWDVVTGKEIRTLGKPFIDVTCLAFSPDGRLLASAGADGEIRVSRVAEGDELYTVRKHTGAIRALAFTPDGRILASGGADGRVKLWDVATGTELATLMTIDDTNSWAVLTPDGLFDGSAIAWNRVLWRFSHDTFKVAPVEVFFNEFYYPGLLDEILAGRQPRAPRDIAQLDRRQPQVKLTLADGQAISSKISTRAVEVRAEVTEVPRDNESTVGSGARDVRLFRNGSLVKVWRGDVLKSGARHVTLKATIPIVAGENRLTAYAFNRDNIKSGDATLMITGAENLKRRGIVYLLSIGVNEYANKDYNLRYAAVDAEAFGDEVQRQQGRIGNFAQSEFIPLFNRDATKANILFALARLAGKEAGALPHGAPAVLDKIKPAQPEDAVFVYYAGHGTAHGPRFYLIPHDLGYAGLRSRLDEDGWRAILTHSISDLELEQFFEKVDAGRLVLVIDACNSGQALEAEEKRRGPMNSKGLAQLAYEKGMNVLTAAQGYQAALEATQFGHGLLTYALVEEGLKTPAADTAPKDGHVDVWEWLDYAALRVPQLQTAMMKEARTQGRGIAIVDGEEKIQDIEKRNLQRPRAFYRREPGVPPFIIAEP